ncbi:hypothetical protein [Hymenobacter cellulosilyticus]|uniref:Uncharacterized protein n=1 Tax=Hymenobacter cellulosilyticus TaxID=2932248 RepID=A0A8T9QDF7_9BACT|nr:hypothetical protein [Hymenobacter cellulosilyticus]UOQ72853.1 hypothetical protein MUN79_02350 [Hymenobacter cellulosilyticus]
MLHVLRQGQISSTEFLLAFTLLKVAPPSWLYVYLLGTGRLLFLALGWEHQRGGAVLLRY